MRKTALLLVLITIFSKILGFAREIVLSYFFGVSNITDAYIISLTIPDTLLAFIGVGITTIYIPMYNKIINEEGINIADRYTNNLINIFLAIFIIIVTPTLFFTPHIVKLFALGFSGDVLNLAVSFTKVTSMCIFFSMLIYLFKGYLNIKGDFVIPSLVIIPYNVFIIGTVFLGSRYSLMILPWGFVIGEVLHMLILSLFACKKGFKYKFTFHIGEEYLRRSLKLLPPVIIGISINQINVLVDKTIASQIVEGGISALNYASKLNGFVQGIFVLSIITVLYPTISKMAAANDVDGLKKSISEAVRSVNILVIPATVGMMVFAEPIITLLFGRGEFNASAISMTSSALFFYSIGIIGFGLRDVLSRAFYALQDTKTPAINAAIAVVINIVLNIVLSRFMGIGGLALATSISAIICTGLLFVSLRRKLGPFGFKDILISFLKITVSSLTMGLIARLSFGILMSIMSQNLSLILSIVIGAISYMIIIYFMKIEDVDNMVNVVKAKINNR